MRLLVSVRTASEAAAAVAGGADIIDAKDPASGALGPVSAETLRSIRAAVRGSRLLTAALGDVEDEAAVERAARVHSAAGAALVKIGFSGIGSAARVASLISAAARGGAIVAVAYADYERASTVPPALVLEAAARSGARGVLLDTADKSGPGLRALIPAGELRAWVADARAARLLVALAGKLTAEDLSFARDVGAEIAGVRGAACDDGRMGQVSVERVRVLRDQMRATDRSAAPIASI